ncbi:MAG: TetR/AcrR family transcriptional regulator [Rhodoferax sp.]|jgi:TetR/AcrR family transcriptional regulator
MLELPGAERITTAALAARLEASEAALYRHFASKAQMFEGLIDFIEHSVFSLVNQITSRTDTPTSTLQASRIVTMVLQFAEKNPGMTRVMVGDALVFEHERLQQRMNLFFDKIESNLKQSLRDSAVTADAATLNALAQVQASVLTAFMVGRLQRFARSGFKRLPSEHLEASLALML